MPFFALLILYLGYRVLIFGHGTPVYYRGVHGTPMDVLRGLGSFVARLISPINLDHAQLLGPLVFRGVFAIWLIGLLVLAWVQRPAVARLIFCAGAFLIALIPANKVMVFGIDDDLTNSRFLYLACLAFSVFVAFFVCGDGRAGARWPVGVLVGYVALSLSLLYVNNQAWANASRLMRTMQEESRRLTGNMVNVEVVNIPDRLHGVFFDRGGFRRSLLVPFVADNAMHRRSQIVHTRIPLPDKPVIEFAFPEPAALNAAPDPSREADSDVAFRISFEPREPKLYEGEIWVRHPSCGRSSARISVRGRGTLAPPFATNIVAAIAPGEAFHTRDDALTVVASIADLKDGIAAEEVSIALLPEEPWSLNYSALDALGRRGSANTPVRIDDGSYKAIVIELMPAPGLGPAALVAPRISALNAPIVPAIPHQTIVDAAGALAIRPAAPGAQRLGDVPGRDGPASDADACPKLRGIPAEVDLGVVPVSPYALRQDRPFTYFALPPALLFWDDTRQRLLRLADLADRPALFEADGGDLWHWQRSRGVQYTRLSATVGGLRVGAPDEFTATSGLDLSTSQAAFCLMTMRVMAAPSPYARLSWKRSPDDPDAGNGQASFIILPDGYWHTYAVPLHASASWIAAQRVRYLRLQPVLAEGWVEIRSIRIIAAPS